MEQYYSGDSDGGEGDGDEESGGRLVGKSLITYLIKQHILFPFSFLCHNAFVKIHPVEKGIPKKRMFFLCFLFRSSWSEEQGALPVQDLRAEAGSLRRVRRLQGHGGELLRNIQGRFHQTDSI